VTDSLDLTGNTQAIYTVQLVARVVGYLEKVLFQDGQRVKKGQPLFVIQQNTYEDNLRQAEAAVLQYRAQLQWDRIPADPLLQPDPAQRAARSDVENWRFQRTPRRPLTSAPPRPSETWPSSTWTTPWSPPRSTAGWIDGWWTPAISSDREATARSWPRSTRSTRFYVYFNISDLDLARLLKITRGIPGPTDGRKWPVHAGLPNEDGYPTRATSTSPPST